MAVAQEQIRQIISENNISGVADVDSLLKESFKIFCRNAWKQRWMYPPEIKKQKGDLSTTNRTTQPFQKTLKSQYGECQVDIPRGRNGKFEPSFIPKYQRNIFGDVFSV